MFKKTLSCRPLFFSPALVLALILMLSSLSQALMIRTSIKNLAINSDAILEGIVIGMTSHWNADRTHIYTEVVIMVQGWLKGPENVDVVSVIVHGGTVDDIRQIVSDTPIVYEGLHSVLFLKKISDERLAGMGIERGNFSGPPFEIYKRFQGQLLIDRGKINDVSLKSFRKEIDYLLDHGETMPGARFIESESPVLVGQARYVYEGMRWEGAWPEVNYQICNSFSAAEKTAIQNAASSWNNAGAKFTFMYDGIHARSPGYHENPQYLQNYANEVFWAELSQGTLALATWWYRVSDKKIIEADFSFNSRYQFSTSTPAAYYDMQSVAVHEFGHWLSLGHSEYPEAVMYPIISNRTIKRTLHSDDIAGIRSVYGLKESAYPVGLYDPSNGVFYFKEALSGGEADHTFQFGPAGMGWVPVRGDWNGDGILGVGLYDPSNSVFFLKETWSGEIADHTFTYGRGSLGWIPVTGDWNGDGTHGVGLYDPSSGVFHLKDALSGGVADYTFQYGPVGRGWIPVSGDWNGNGISGVGLYDPSNGLFYLKDSLSGGVADYTFSFGPEGCNWKPVSGDWNGDGTHGIGLYDSSAAMFYLKESLSGGVADHTFAFGPSAKGWISIQ